MATEAEKIHQAIAKAASKKAKVDSPDWTQQLMMLNQLVALNEMTDEDIMYTENRFDTTKELILQALNILQGNPMNKSLDEQIEEVTQDTATKELMRLCELIAGYSLPIDRRRFAKALAKKSGQPVSLLLSEVQKFAKQSKQAVDEAQAADGTDSSAVPKFADQLPDCPAEMPKDLMVPPKYIQRPDGRITRDTDQGPQQVSPTPVVITKRLVDIDDETISLEVAYRRNGVWRKTTQSRRTFLDTKAILKCADYDLPVSSDNATEMVRYLANLDQFNQTTIKDTRCVKTLGWREEDGVRKFVLGTKILSAQGESNELSVEPDDVGESQILKSLVTGGTWEDWVDLFQFVQPFARMCLAVYASLASPLLTLVKGSGFAMHFCGNTTKGKTTALQLAASVWGYPGGNDLSELTGLIGGWEGTAVANERRFGFFRHLPVFLDDSQLANQEVAAKTAYWAVNGSGRRRGSLHGSQKTYFWHLVLLSTGERTMAETTRNGGMQVRAIDMWGDVLEAPNDKRYQTVPQKGDAASRIRTLCGRNFGHAGERFLNALFEKDVKKLQERFQQIHENIKEAIGADVLGDLGGRLISAFASILLAAEILHKDAGRDTWMEKIDPALLQKFVVEEFRLLLGENKLQHSDLAAYDEVVSWAMMNTASFINSNEARGRKDAPHGGWLGVWETKPEGKDGQLCIGFDPNKLKEFLTKQGHSYNSVLRGWRERGILEIDSDGKNTRQVRWGTSNEERSRFIVIHRPEIVKDDDVLEIFPEQQEDTYKASGSGASESHF